MKRKPWAIIVIASLHFVAPFGNLILNSMRSGRGLIQTWHYWVYALPTPLVITYVALPPLAGIFIYICRRWSYWCYVACLGLIFLSNVYSFWTSMSLLNFAMLFLVLLIDVVAVAYFMVPSVRQVYFDARLRWWETAPRFNLEVSGVMNGDRGFIKNISAGGALVESSLSYVQDQDVTLEWSYEGKDFKIPGHVIYQKPSGGLIGFGVKFTHTLETQQAMSGLTELLNKQDRIVKDRLPGPEDTFKAWIKKLITTRQGLFPKRGR